jgi:hypothetical protein
MGRLWGLLIAITVSFMVISCGRPIGSISNSGYDNFWIVSTHPTYDYSRIDGKSLSKSDISAFASFQGAVDIISIGKVTIFIEDFLDSELKFIRIEEVHVFDRPGKKRIRAEYSGMKAEYSIHVLDPNDDKPPGYGSGGAIDGGMGGNFIEW